MNAYVVLIRGVNVGGKSRVPMAELKQHLGELGFANVSTYIASGNVLLQTNLSPQDTAEKIEVMMAQKFKLESVSNKVLVLSHTQLQAVVNNKPKGFGEHPEDYYSDAIFLMGIGADEAMAVFSPREGVDKVWPGEGVIYSQRLGAERTKSRLSKIMGTPLYKSMTIRSWGTTVKLLALLEATAKSD
jgi:uncharacterized protein (DUF1697 family)